MTSRYLIILIFTMFTINSCLSVLMVPDDRPLARGVESMDVQEVAVKATIRYNNLYYPSKQVVLLEVMEAQSRRIDKLGTEYLISFVVGITGCTRTGKDNCRKKDVEFVDFIAVETLKTYEKEFVFTFHKIK
ncbi:unnamed protein product [Bursaphelenchus okinawaensis]|uniref:Cystatin domain-containing protein n=1 Tax=Bursaphelenchus okinawaensis TaxID=465554 RepID=A0A811L7J6_9BILA|nr:unnamed protein product [Bursaphelenchus okinawaensis]CAG9117263.1 unnamed protein product [Bursaphelenchus okinawaensis]